MAWLEDSNTATDWYGTRRLIEFVSSYDDGLDEGRYAQGAAELELQHQRKLTASAMQYKKLKDAFNDLVVAARDDSAEAKVS
jgi:hypothetical protein